MKILYRNSKIEKLCTDYQKAKKKLGVIVANKLFAVVKFLISSVNLKDILVLPQYHLHKLSGNYEGIYSIYLGKQTGFRLLIIPLNENEQIIQVKDMSIYTLAVCLEIREVSKHYE